MKVIFAIAIVSITVALGFQGATLVPRRMMQGRLQGRLSMMAEGESNLKTTLSTDMKAAMKAKEKLRLGAIRAIQTAIKQKEVDERIEVDDNMAIEVMAKLVKSRRESVKSYEDAGRTELAENEKTEIEVIQSYMPAQMSSEEVAKAIEGVIADVGATTVKDMGKVMGKLRPMLAGRADMSTVGDKIKAMLK